MSDILKNSIVESCRYDHPVLGSVHVRVHGTTRHLKARWVGQEVRLTVPPGIRAADCDRFLARVQERLLEARPKMFPGIGSTIEAPFADFTIRPGEANQRRDVRIHFGAAADDGCKKAAYIIYIKEDAESRLGRADFSRLLNDSLLACARHATVEHILPLARGIAERVGRYPVGWQVKETKTRLGSCTSTGIITLSPRLVFMPLELCEFVICHELAHLSEMNHSSAFHELCDSYCGGREAELQAKVRAFRFPVF